MRRILGAAALVLAVGVAQASAANLVLNGSFEECVGAGAACGGTYQVVTGPTLQSLTSGQWGVYKTIPHWSTTDGSGIEIQRGTIVTAQDGSSYVELDSHVGTHTNSTMSQSIALTAGSYELSFWYRPRTNTTGDNGINVLFGAVDPLGQVGSNPTANATTSSMATWTRFLYTLQAPTTATYRLTFSAVGTENTLGGFVDNVELHAVPEPGSLLVFAMGSALVGLRAARRRT